ncbi:thermonuclease family protein [Pseudomonas sp. B392_1p]|uniref:thermonuclease family protein n=1 Tax=Pseudomonas sp. B392_1p TaxID=3457507 RepID=UPI003FD226A3
MRRAIPLVFILLTSPALAAQLECRVVAISDGDTLTCLTAEKRQVKVRLAEIDTPESRQPYGNRARQALSELAFQRDVRLDVHETDRYGRTVARVHAGQVDVNAEMVRQGASWVYRQYSRDKSLLLLEAEAKQAKRGLWALPEAERVAPWDWRKNGGSQQRARQTIPALAGNAAVAYSCSPRKTCGQMASCAEARFHLEQCGNNRLDGDRDGVPCEALCR